jgi:exonuclease III
MGNSSSAGKGKGTPLTFATQNVCGINEEKLCYCVDMRKDVFALTELHSDLSNSRCAAELGKRLITCGKIDKENDKAAGVAILLSPRCSAAVSDQGTLAPNNASRARICWCRIDAKPCHILAVAVYWPHSARTKAPFREDTAGELLQLLRSVAKKNDSVVILGDFNSRLARGDKGFTGPFTPHARMDDGGVLMKEISTKIPPSGGIGRYISTQRIYRIRLPRASACIEKCRFSVA